MLYIVQRMTEKEYDRMMLGMAPFYWIEHIEVEAETPEEAAKLVSLPGYIVNEDCIKTKEEIDREEAEYQKKLDKIHAKEEAAKQRKIDRETEKAAALGLTREVYNRIKRHESKVRSLERDLEYAQWALEDEKQYLAKIKAEAGLSANEVVK